MHWKAVSRPGGRVAAVLAVTVLALTTAAPAHPADAQPGGSNGLEGLWKLDENGGSSANDISGNANTATLTGATWTGGVYGSAANFNGTTNHVTLPDSASLRDVQENDYTLAAWFRPASVPQGTGSANNANYAILTKPGYHLGLYYDGAKRFHMGHYLTGDIYREAVTSGTFEPKVWHLVTGVVSRTAGTVRIYVDGLLQGTSSFTPGAAAREYGSAQWRLGVAQPGASTYRWAAAGSIDEARVFSRAISDTEVRGLVTRQPAAPTFAESVFDGPADGAMVWNAAEQTWWVYYTQHRANVPSDGFSYCFGTAIGIASSPDGGQHWTYRGTMRGLDVIDAGTNSFWAPSVIYNPADGRYHAFITYVTGVWPDFGHPKHIAHYSSADGINWTWIGPLIDLGTTQAIDADVEKMPDGVTWRMWYKDEDDWSTIHAADSTDLKTWTPVGLVLGDRSQEGPTVFTYGGYSWLLTDPWNGIGVYRSTDMKTWTAQPGFLAPPPGGTRPGDSDQGRHPGVAVHGGNAYLFYYTHPNPEADHRSVLMVSKLEVAGGVLTTNRDAAFPVQLGDDGVSGRWDFDQATGATVGDLSGNNNIGTLVGAPQWVPGQAQHGGALSFGGGAYVNTPASASLRDVQEGGYTVSAWFRPATVPAGAAAEANNHAYAVVTKSGDDPTRTIGLFYGNDQRFHLAHELASGVRVEATTTDTFPAGQWYAVAGVVDRAAGTVRVYVNGLLGGSATFPAGGSAREFDTATWKIGIARPDAATYRWAADGTVDAVGIQHRALTGREVAGLAGVVADLNFSEGSGNATADATLNNNHGQLIPDAGAGHWAWGEGTNGGGVTFRGNDGFANLYDSDTLRDVQEGDYSVAAWFKPNSVPAGTGADNTSNYAIVVKTGWDIGLLYDHAGHFNVSHVLAGDVPLNATTTATYPPGSWYHVVGVVSRSTGTVSVYVNGVRQATVSFAAGTPVREFWASTWKVGIGAPGASTYRWAADGSVDGVRIYDRAMPDDEVARLFRHP